ncbi:MAG: DMT family transporter [Kiloniellales bacterium]
MSQIQQSTIDAATPLAAVPSQRPLAGILFLLLGTTLFPIQDVIIKSFSDTYAVHQIVFLRSLCAIPVVLIIAHVDGGLRPFKIGSIGLQTLRAGTAFLSYLVYYMALAAIGLAETASITFSTPLFVTVFALFFLGEKIGLQRWAAVIVGLIGVLVIVRPGLGVFEPAAILALLAAIAYAVSIVATRKLGPTARGSSMTIFILGFFTLGGGLTGLIFSQIDIASPHPSLAFLFRPWSWPEPAHWPLFAALGLISGIGFFALTQAYRLADASVVTPFEYTYLPWAILWGFVFFGNLPDLATWLGLTLIVGAGLFILFRESVRGRAVVSKKGLGVMRQR